MKESSSTVIEKPFSCDIDGCLMKFTNEDHLMVHKKRHDMVLNLGLAPKGNTCSDQTPTPTRFIRNCEEVGLFQDLQNVNPFEETFRKATEAVKTGQTPVLFQDKSFQSNPPDDTLHTPKIFPHIVDLHCVDSSGNLVNQESKQSEDNALKKRDEDVNTDGKELVLKLDNEPRKLILGSVSHRKRKTEHCDEQFIVGVQNHAFNELTTSENDNATQQVIQFTESSSEINPVQVALKEKIKSNLQSKQLPAIIQLKVPIPKSSSTFRYQKSQKDKFSTFSKNSLKYESKLEKPQSGIFDLSKKRRAKRSYNYNGLPKERIEILERNRAAATRCREKKKSYISYLEKLSRELTDANKKLLGQNMHLRKQISVLQTELLKHQDCNITTGKPDKILAALAGAEVEKNCEIDDATKNQVIKSAETVSVENKGENNFFKLGDDLETVTVFDTVEVSLSDNSIEDVNKNSTCFRTIDEMNRETNSSKLFCEEVRLRRIYNDHSYSNYTNAVDARKKSFTCSMAKPKVNGSVISMDNKLQKVTDKNDKESYNIALAQRHIPALGAIDSNEPLIIFSQPSFVLKTPISRKSRSKEP